MPFVQSRQYDLGHQRMQAEMRAENELDFGELSGKFQTVCFEVRDDVNSRRQEIWQHQDPPCTAIRTRAASGGDRRLSQLQVRDFNDRIGAATGNQSCQLHEIGVRRSTPTPVGNE